MIEIAIGLFIITILATVLLTPITTQITQAKIHQAKADLDQINEALIGYALAQPVKPSLPCPDATIGAGANDGLSDVCGTALGQTVGGNIPWVTLNVPSVDPWGQRYQYRVNSAYADPAGFSMTMNLSGACNPPGTAGTGNLFQTTVGQIKICGDSACATVLANTNVPAVIFSRGPNGATAPTSPDEIENIDNDCLFVSRPYSGAAGVEFDDLVVWVSPGLLVSRMVAAQKLP